MTRRKLTFAAVAVLLAIGCSVAALFAADLYLHKRAERSAGLNIWGYRGPVVSMKRPGEVRIAVLGGSTVFGYGLTWDQAFPRQLEQRLNARTRPPRHFTVINLGYNSEGAYSFRYTLADYAYLHPDIVCLYEGYNDLMGDANGGNPAVYRHQSALFRATGYMPILPLVLREKALAMRSGGHLNDAYVAEGKTVFRPTLAVRATSGALDAAARIGDELEAQIARLGRDEPAAVVKAGGSGCAHPWSDYCQSVANAIDAAIAAHQRVIFATQPYLTGERGRDRHIWQQRAVVAMIAARYKGRPDVAYISLANAVDLRDSSLAFDGMHLTRAGNERIAERLVQPLLQMTDSLQQAASR